MTIQVINLQLSDIKDLTLPLLWLITNASIGNLLLEKGYFGNKVWLFILQSGLG